ncbi:MAG: globin domain-containing protein, partial [Alphaproteobacteria bacterium]|nr:globin domain-containing protein [Alphaproteobacteria bacterium]
RPKREEFVLDFYQRLFERAPEVRGMFADDVQPQSMKLLTTLALAVASLERLDDIVAPLKSLGTSHAALGVRPEHYPVVVDVFVDTLAAALGPHWRSEHEKAWRDVLDVIASTMIAGADAASSQAA